MAERATLGQFSFNGGELSRRMQGRVDQSVYQISVAGMLGWLPIIQGPAVAAPGTIFVEAAAGPARLIPFEYNPTQGYVVEGSNLKFRFYTNDARIETSPGVAYEVAHPYSHAELLTLDYWQDRDVLYLAGGGRQQATLSRTGASTFAYAALALRNGPIGPGNANEAVTVTASGVTGSVTLTATGGNIFAATDVGSLFEIEAADFNDVPSWEPGIDGVSSGSTKRSWAGNVYLAASSGRTGTVAPIHDSGTEWDGTGTGTDINGKGPYGVKWTHLYGRYGLLRITGYTSPTQVTATVIKRLADSVTATATWRWAFGLYSDTRGWPEAVCLWNERLCLAKGNRLDFSVVGDYDNFERRDSAGDFQRDLAGSCTLPKPGTIQWLVPDTFLLAGTVTDEFRIELVQIQTGTPGPPVFDAKVQTSNGSRPVKPIQADGRVLFAQRAGRKLREMNYAIASDRYQAPDMTRLANHIGARGFVDLAWQAEPERFVWAVRGDGTMAALTYDPDQTVMGWAPRQLGNAAFPLLAESDCRITDPDGLRDQIWIAAQAPGGARWILRMAKLWEEGDDQADAILLDAALSYEGAPADEISGLDHLEGATVSILADGKPHRDLVVDGGAVALDYEASKIHVGVAYPASLTLLSPEGGQQEGTAQTKLKRVIALNLRVVETQGIRVSVQGGQMVPVETRVPADAMDEAVPLFTGDLSIATIGTYDRLGQVTIERFQPTPATIAAAFPVMEVGET